MSTDTSKLDEQLFVLLALEEGARQWDRLALRWLNLRPAVKEKETLTASAGRPAANRTTPILVAQCLAELRLELAKQRLEYDTLRRHIQMQSDDQFMREMEKYEAFLASLDKNITALEQPFAQFQSMVRQIQNAAATHALATGLNAALHAWANGEREETVWAAGLIGGAAGAGQARKQSIQATDPLSAQLTTQFDTFIDGLNEVIPEEVKTWAETTRGSNRNSPELAFNVTHDGTKSGNPFELAARVYAKALQEGVATDRLIDYAGRCRDASGRVPAAKAFDFYRAYLLEMAGTIANRAAAKDLGTTGLPLRPEDAPKGGRLAKEIWDAYLKFQPRDTAFNDTIVRAHFLAHAYAGDPQRAWEILEKHAVETPQFKTFRPMPLDKVTGKLRLSVSSQAGFWYDCARVCSISGRTKVALLCLTHAIVRLKYPDKATAQLSPDFRQLRENRETRDGFARLFNAAIPGRPIR